MKTPAPVLRRPDAEEFPAFWALLSAVFGEAPHDEDREREATVFEPERSLVAMDGDDIVATAGIFSRVLTVPGALLPVAGVTLVGVAPTHRRRGLLRSMITQQLTELHESAAEPVAALWASESVIYQRFGYGSAAPRARATGLTRDTAFRPEVPTAAGRLRLVPAAAARPHLAHIYDALRPARPGLLDRPQVWADYRYADPEHHRDGATALQYVVHTDDGGVVDGVAAYRVKADDGDYGPDGVVTVLDVLAADVAVEAALWRHVFDLDLVRKWRRWSNPLDSVLAHLLLDPRAMRQEVVDSLWVRLVDVDRALAARRYRTDIDVVLEVSDQLCPWNAGRWRLSGGPDGAVCAATTDAAEIRLSSTELGAVYLGGPTLVGLAAAGRVQAESAAVLDRAAVAFGWPVAPYCPEVF
ncbi:MAG: GNAT family N-acetyltransferase [Geodermatophilaceae bacterium]|nr:GNAT family N-acetyltransferase [Geodermatophilaceae bacterium]